MRYRADLPADSAIRRILVIKWSAMGDVILATALFEDIARAFPGRELHLNTLPVWQGLFAEDTRFQYILAIDLRDSSQQVTAFHEWLRRVRNQHYDLVIDLQCNDRSRLLLSVLWLSGCRIPYCLGNQQQFPYNIAPAELPKPAHTIARGRAALWAGNIPATTLRPVLHIPGSHYARAWELMTANDLLPDQFAVFLPGCNANGYLKRWGAARYAALANRLHQAGLGRIVLIGGPDEIEECQRIAQACGPWLINLCGQTAILDIPPLCEPARFIVANDTGVAHLAAATATPMLVLCGPTDPRRVKPLGDNVVTLQADLPCINCYRKTCSHHSCMAMLTPSLVFRHLRELVY
ncbi:MAG: glycosyltransferase family 9 protein [Candidatus Competibacteraceae bacterium]|nr:glycosyltransferase family 9 protein [Candidatus Competibacteraceae bacterium]HRY15559.1 glycosyltransferase family 9 protein [Candidatus Competibacteraceae bacterium]